MSDSFSVITQDIRRFFAPTSAKPAAPKTAPNGNPGKDAKKPKSSSDEDLKNKNKRPSKARIKLTL